MVEGLLNTLRVAVVGILAATVLGTVIGIARLSTNWIVRQLATVYVEAVRNMPLALFLICELPGGRARCVPTDHRCLGCRRPRHHLQSRRCGRVVTRGRGSACSSILAVGVLVWFAVAKWRGRVADRTGALPRSGLWGFAAFALVVALGWIGFGYATTLPSVEGRATAGGIRIDPSFFALFLALTVYTSSHIAEIVRGSIQAVPRGQGEAADAVALSGFQRMWYVILPQALRIGIPPIGNQYLNLIKNSSLGAAIGYYDLTLVAQTTVGNGSPAVPVFVLVMVVYIMISLVVSALVNVANRRMTLVER